MIIQHTRSLRLAAACLVTVEMITTGLIMSGCTQVKEPLLVRDVLYACQGIDGKLVKFEASVLCWACSQAWGATPPWLPTLAAWDCSFRCVLERVPKRLASSFQAAWCTNFPELTTRLPMCCSAVSQGGVRAQLAS